MNNLKQENIISARKFCHAFRFIDNITQLIFTCSKSTIDTLEKGVKYVKS